MSVVYQASKNERKSVALKVIRSQYLDNQVDRSRIEREISTLTQIKSKFVCQIIDSDITEDFAWIATEYINGPDLKTKVNLDGPYGEDDWYLLSKGLLEGLKAIHAYGVIHRDIKPTNILISADGPKIIDFGIAQSSEATSLTSTGLIAGSPAWLSPEQINGDKVTYSSDIFSAGAVLNFAVSGISPWGDNTKITKDVIYNRILQKQPDLSSLSILQKSLVQQMMEKTPKSRPSADQSLIYLNDKWSEEAKLKKQLEEEEKQREKEEKQKREEKLLKIKKNRQRLKKVILEPILMRRKILSLALASVFILASTGTYAFTSYSSKTGIFQFMAESDSIEIETPEEIIAQPQPKTVTPRLPVVSPSPTPSPSVSIAATKTVETNNAIEEDVIVNTKKNIVGNNIDLNKTKICLTIFQHGTNDNYCYKDLPVTKEPDYTFHRGITPYSEEEFLFLYVPWTKTNIYGCTKISYTVQGQSHLNGELFFNDWGTGTMNRTSAEATPHEFCKTKGGFDYAINFANQNWNGPYFNVAAFDKSKPLPQNYEIIQDHGDYKINYIYTWQKR
jgi:serine/threonine protein kinase